jgi:hypothetical protein
MLNYGARIVRLVGDAVLTRALFGSLMLLACASQPAAASLEVRGTDRWVVLASRAESIDATDLARDFGRDVSGVRVVKAANGWHAVIVGPVAAK